MGHHHFTSPFAEDVSAPFYRRSGEGRSRGSRRARGGFGGPYGGQFGGPGGPFGGPFGGLGGPEVADLMRGFAGPRGHRGRGPGGPGGSRRRRGDVRAAILDVLATHGSGGSTGEPLNGYQVIQTIAERTEQAWKPSPGSVYPTIAQLEDEGLVRTDEVGGRKVLRLTEEGQTYVAEHADELAAVWAPFAEQAEEDGSGRHLLKKGIGETMAAVWQVAAAGSPAQVEQAVEVLAETRKRLYTILAEGDPERE